MNYKSNVVIGITTCYGKKQILETLKSIRASEDMSEVRIVIVSDRILISPDLREQMAEVYRAEVIENGDVSSAFAKQKQIISLCDPDDILIMTQDDVLFHPKALAEVFRLLEKGQASLVGVINEPLSPHTLFERAANVGTRLGSLIGRVWNGGDNYLACLGRLMAFRVSWLKSLEVAIDSVSLDAYLYLENKMRGGSYKCVWNYPLYFRNPWNMAEQLRKSSRFQYSREEMASYGRFENLDIEYEIPLRVVLFAGIREFLRDPFGFSLYLPVFLYSRLFRIPKRLCLFANWEVDLSTKQISVGDVKKI